MTEARLLKPDLPVHSFLSSRSPRFKSQRAQVLRSLLRTFLYCKSKTHIKPPSKNPPKTLLRTLLRVACVVLRSLRCASKQTSIHHNVFMPLWICRESCCCISIFGRPWSWIDSMDHEEPNRRQGSPLTSSASHASS